MAFLKKVHTKLALYPRRLVRGLLDGTYASVAAGRSLEFADLRTYVRGDDVKDIDWKSSARTGELLVKRYVAQRRHTLAIVVPAGPELAAASSVTETKADIALMAAGVLGYVAGRRGDFVTVVSPGEVGPTIARPSYREVDLERMLMDIDRRCRLDAGDVSMEELMGFATTAVRRRSIVLLILDDWQVSPHGLEVLTKLSLRHETLAVCLHDVNPTRMGTAAKHLVDLDNRRLLADYVWLDDELRAQVSADRRARRQERLQTLTRLGIVHQEVRAADDVIPAMIRLLEGMRHVARR